MRLDPTLICFLAVVIAAIPVTLLRSKTYALGYELAALKEQERECWETRARLASRSAAAYRDLHRHGLPPTLHLPGPGESLWLTAPLEVTDTHWVGDHGIRQVP